MMRNSNRVTTYWYDQDFDCLYLADISPIGVRGDYTNGMTLTEQQGVGFVIRIDEHGRCIGFECFDAAELLLPHLLPDHYERTDFKTNLVVEYCADTDIMTLSNGEIAVYSEPVTEDWITHFGNDMDPFENWDVGGIVGFTLGHVSENILPLLLRYAPSEHDPEKQERMRRFRGSNVAG